MWENLREAICHHWQTTEEMHHEEQWIVIFECQDHVNSWPLSITKDNHSGRTGRRMITTAYLCTTWSFFNLSSTSLTDTEAEVWLYLQATVGVWNHKRLCCRKSQALSDFFGRICTFFHLINVLPSFYSIHSDTIWTIHFA